MTLQHRVWMLALVVVLAALTVPAQAITTTRVTVTTAATLIYTASTGGNTVLIKNVCAAAVYLGASTVTTGTGFEVGANEAVSLPLGPSDPVYGIVAAATCVQHVLESRR